MDQTCRMEKIAVSTWEINRQHRSLSAADQRAQVVCPRSFFHALAEVVSRHLTRGKDQHGTTGFEVFQGQFHAPDIALCRLISTKRIDQNPMLLQLRHDRQHGVGHDFQVTPEFTRIASQQTGINKTIGMIGDDDQRSRFWELKISRFIQVTASIHGLHDPVKKSTTGAVLRRQTFVVAVSTLINIVKTAQAQSLFQPCSCIAINTTLKRSLKVIGNFDDHSGPKAVSQAH